MEKAVAQLEKLDTRSAITHEMEALNQLLKAEAEIRRRQLARQQGGQGGGRGRTGNEDLSALFDEELMRQQTNYAQQSSVETRQENTKGESALDRIRELARRQDDLAREQQQLARERSQLTAEEAKRPPVIGAPSISTVPSSATSAPDTILISVDLPAPFSPTRACTSPARTSKSTPRSARTPP
jgi:hypothetical protein